jgi:MFS family permease
MMATMDASITNIAFPALTEVFQAELTTVVWVTVAYILVSTSSMLIIGRIGDIMGRKRIYVTGMGIFTLGLLACALAMSVGQLIFFRTFQAVGAAMTISTSTAIVTEAYPLWPSLPFFMRCWCWLLPFNVSRSSSALSAGT